MTELQKRFPIAKVPAEQLQAIAARARASAKITVLPQRRRRPRLLEVAVILLTFLLGYLTYQGYAVPHTLTGARPKKTENPRTQPPSSAKDNPELAPHTPEPAPVAASPFDRRREAIGLALAWLAAQQDPDGKIDGARFRATGFTTATTGLAMLAFTTAGHTEQEGSFKDNVQRGVRFLLSQQQENGKILFAGDQDNGYQTAIATLALIEAFPSAADTPETTRAAVQKAVDYCANIHQCDNGGFGYKAGVGGHTSPAGWFGQVLFQAQARGFSVRPECFKKLAEYLESAKLKGEPAYAYSPGGGFSHNCSAIGFLLRTMAGAKPEQLRAGVELMLSKTSYPKWDRQPQVYYWQFAGPTVLNQGGDIAKRWSESLDLALLPTQDMDGDLRGSWPNIGQWILMLGRAGQTAVTVMSLTQTYRFDTGVQGPIEPIPGSVRPITRTPMPSPQPAAEPAKQIDVAPEATF